MGMASFTTSDIPIAYRVVKWLLRLYMDIALLDRSGSAFAFSVSCFGDILPGWRGAFVFDALLTG